LGGHRLRDLSRPERLFQVLHADLDAEFPVLDTLDSRPGNLPTQLTSFVGRDVEVQRLADELTHSRLITLTGVGKTRLATHVAAEIVSRFTDGAWICELAAAGDSESMVQVVAATLGARP